MLVGMTNKSRNTTFVNIGVTPETRDVLNAEVVRGVGLAGRRIAMHHVIRAALVVANRHHEEMAAELLEAVDPTK